MAPKKVRANLYLDQELWERFKAVAGKLPNTSASQLIDHSLSQLVPFLEKTVELAQKGDRDAFLALATMKMGQLAEGFGVEMANVRNLPDSPKKGEESSGG